MEENRKAIGAEIMRAHYDFSKMKARRNPYLRFLKQSVTIRLDRDTVEYFKALSAKTGLPYQNLINLYLRDCATRGKEPSLKWAPAGRRTPRPGKRSGARSAAAR
jgi:uncharacterized protein (DUF4415 family)